MTLRSVQMDTASIKMEIEDMPKGVLNKHLVDIAQEYEQECDETNSHIICESPEKTVRIYIENLNIINFTCYSAKSIWKAVGQLVSDYMKLEQRTEGSALEPQQLSSILFQGTYMYAFTESLAE